MTDPGAAARVRARLAQPGVLWDEAAMAADIAALTPRDRAEILAEEWQAGRILTGPEEDRRRQMALSEISSGPEEGGPGLILSPGLAARTIRALLDLAQAPRPLLLHLPEEHRDWMWKSKILHCLTRVFCGLTEPFGPGDLVNLQTGMAFLDHLAPEVGVVAARAMGDDRLAGAARAALRKRFSGPLALAELEAVLAEDHLALLRAGLAVLCRAGPLAREVAGADDAAFADIPAVRAFAPGAIAETLERIEAIQSGRQPYKADGLMTVDEAQTVARAVGLALDERDERGLSVLARLWMGAAVAPDPKAKTMPSQSLTIALGNLAVGKPAPEAVMALRDVAGAVRHAGVKKKLDRMLPAARTALGRDPDRLLDLAMRGPLERPFLKLLKPALEGLLSRTHAQPAALWRDQLTGPDLWPLTSALIWEVDGRAHLLTGSAKALVWQARDGTTLPFAPDQSIRLWHPAEATEAERIAWRQAVLAGALDQPFAQAFREVYALPPDEAAGSESALFAGHAIAQIPAFGLSRRSGWRVSPSDRLVLRLDGRRFEFDAGIALYPGADGIGVTGAVRIAGPEKRFADLPPRLLSEALRAVDLLVTVGAAGVSDTARVTGVTGRLLWPGSTSLAMREALLRLVRPEARIEGRWLWLDGGLRINLATGRIDGDGTTLPPPAPKAAARAPARAPARADDPVMAAIWAAIGAYGLARGAAG